MTPKGVVSGPLRKCYFFRSTVQFITIVSILKKPVIAIKLLDVGSMMDGGFYFAVLNEIKAGQIECGIAGGVDFMSDVPIRYNRSSRAKMLASQKVVSSQENRQLLVMHK